METENPEQDSADEVATDEPEEEADE